MTVKTEKGCKKWSLEVDKGDENQEIARKKEKRGREETRGKVKY